MKILFITTMNPNHQGDYFEITLINGLRKLLGIILLIIQEKNNVP